MHKIGAALWRISEPFEPHGQRFLCLHVYVHIQMCVGVFWGVTCNIHHLHRQRHGEISLDSKSPPSRNSLSCGPWKIFWTAGAHFPWGSCLVTHQSYLKLLARPLCYRQGGELNYSIPLISEVLCDVLHIFIKQMCALTAQQVKVVGVCL